MRRPEASLLRISHSTWMTSSRSRLGLALQESMD